MYSTSAILLIVSLFLLLTLVGLLTITNAFVQHTRRFWKGLYRMTVYLYKRSSGYPQNDAMHFAITR